MRRFTLWGVGLLIFSLRFVDAQGEQAVLTKAPVSKEDWDLTKGPAKNATDNLVFDTVGSFLQHWPNTRYRNGHNIVPGVVPIGTLLYHGTYKNQIPEAPDWIATDPEHAYLFCGAEGQQNSATRCWQLTLVATRPLKVLYFDGSSAAKMVGGPMDSQDLVIWGRVRPESVWKERERVDKLCKWGKRYGLDGFVRMEMSFEIILCDFTAGVKPVSFLNLATENMFPLRKPKPKPSGPLQPPSLTLNTTQDLRPSPLGFQRRIDPVFGVLESASWHNQYPGDLRIQLDYSRIISFYDSNMFPSLQVMRAGKGRLNHSLKGIAPSDALQFSLHLDELLKNDSGIIASGIDWAGLIKQIMQRYAERLELFHYILNSTNSTSERAIEDTLKQAHRYLSSMLAPYTLHTSVPPTDDSASMKAHSWAAPVFKYCATTHTSHLETISTGFTYSEKYILQSIQGVSKEICRVLVTTWAEGMETDAIVLDLVEASSPIQKLLKTWKSRVEDLMAWLDWSHWRTCRPACSYEEMCYLPTWPFFLKTPPGPLPPGPQGSTEPPSRFRTWVQETLIDDILAPSDPRDGWTDPQPSCIRRIEPLESL